MVMQSQKDNNKIFHMRGITWYVENNILNCFTNIRALGDF